MDNGVRRFRAAVEHRGIARRIVEIADVIAVGGCLEDEADGAQHANEYA